MPNQQVIDNIRQENHPLLIFQAFNNNTDVIPLTTGLISYISEVYRSIEPSHFEGRIIVFSSINDTEILSFNDGERLYDKTVLTNNTSNVLIIQRFSDGIQLPILWENADPSIIINNNSALVYNYESKVECFYANQKQITINNPYNCASIYALQYQFLLDSLNHYKEEIRKSSCLIFAECWGTDTNYIFFRNAPEDKMQESLEQHLRKSIRGVDIVREYNIGASKPVDIRIYWKEANRQALIELKWLGKARKLDGTLTNSYSDKRANDGALQIKSYLEKAEQDTPTSISKGFLVIIDGRRHWTNQNTTTITRSKGMHFKNKDIIFETNRKYYLTMKNYEKPIRIFAEPICVD